MAKVLIYTEKKNLAAELVTAAKVIDGSVCAAAFNDNDFASAVAGFGVDVYAVENAELALGDTAAMASALKQVAEAAGADVVLLASNRRGKELAGRLAQVMEAGCLTDVGALAVNGGEIVASRNALGGATVAESVIKTEKKVFAIAGKSFMPAEEAAAGTVNALGVDITPSVKIVETKEKAVESVDITAADVLVSIGQGSNSESQVELATEIAKALGGEISCSKPLATDRKWLSEERIVGISGRLCKPELAITLGVSGQVQFSVGIRDAKTIVAVDKDENAPIFQVADYGLVADLAEALPEIKNAI